MIISAASDGPLLGLIITMQKKSLTSIRAKLAQKEHKFLKDEKICNLSKKKFMHKDSVSDPDSLNPDSDQGFL
jgi:hypothetical protein